MRFIDYETILEQMAAVFEKEVLPKLTDVEARQQTWAAIGLLDNIASRLRDQEDRIAHEIELLEGLIAAAPAAVMAPGADEPVAAGQPLRQRRMALADALSQALSGLAGSEPEPAVDAWLERCGEVLLEIEAGELERMRATRYYQSMRG